MTKMDLSEALGLSQTTISRYMQMGLPFTKEKGKCQFDLDEVVQWKRDNILPTRRADNSPDERTPTTPEIAGWSLNFSLALLNFMQKKCCKSCQAKWFH